MDEMNKKETGEEPEYPSVFDEKERYYQGTLCWITKLLDEHKENCRPFVIKNYAYKLELIARDNMKTLYRIYETLNSINESESRSLDYDAIEDSLVENNGN